LLADFFGADVDVAAGFSEVVVWLDAQPGSSVKVASRQPASIRGRTDLLFFMTKRIELVFVGW
jgi:hypothetical protein